MRLDTIDQIKGVQSNLIAVFSTPQGQEVMGYLEDIGSWYPKMNDSGETNEIIARDANRRLLGTIKTLLKLTPEQVMALKGE